MQLYKPLSLFLSLSLWGFIWRVSVNKLYSYRFYKSIEHFQLNADVLRLAFPTFSFWYVFAITFLKAVCDLNVEEKVPPKTTFTLF